LPRHPGSHSAEFYRNRKLVLDASDICFFCTHPGARQVNHIIPRKLGGTDAISNLTPAHGHDDRTGRSGVDFRCPTCGVSCNQAYRNDPNPPSYRSRVW
jgi:hypothetical protein